VKACWGLSGVSVKHHPKDPWVKNRFGTGLPPAFGHHAESQPAEASGDTPGEEDSPESLVNFSVSAYPQLFLNNPTRAVQRGLVAAGPTFFLPVEVNGRVGPIRLLGEVGYNIGNHSVPQSWERGLLVGHEFGDRTEAYSNYMTSRTPTVFLLGRVEESSPQAIRSSGRRRWVWVDSRRSTRRRRGTCS
jgi:hypothetical protein